MKNFDVAVTFKFQRNLLRDAGFTFHSLRYTRLTPFMFYYVYILQSGVNQSLYIGYTTDLIKRFKQHNDGDSKATKPILPYKLIFYEAFRNRIDAKHREIYLKSGYGRRTINKMISSYFGEVA